MLRVFRTNDVEYIKHVMDIAISADFGSDAVDHLIVAMRSRPTLHTVVWMEPYRNHVSVTRSNSRHGIMSVAKQMQAHGWKLCAISFPGERASYRHWLRDFVASGAYTSAAKLALFLI